ncbi:hypothetical protein P7C70_g5978, partial [Phenoliferia sp. Uapishka_3]
MFGPIPIRPYSGPFGLYYIVTSYPSPVPIALLSVSANAVISDLSAQVTISQVYQAPSRGAGSEASYAFPVPARAVVLSFVLIKQDGTRVVGTVQEKEEAQNTYDEAVSQGKLASLMVQDTPDVFNVSVGNLLPSEIVKVELVYATELTEDEENDSVRFHLPAHVGSRYGASPISAAASSPVSASSTFLNFTALIESSSPITKISCPTHTLSMELGPDPSLRNATSLLFSNHARISFTSGKDLSTDVIITLKSSGLDSPRCVAEVHPDEDHKTVALALTMVPRFKLPDIPKQEFVFLVDRSGSMQGTRMETAKKALQVLLRSLPALGTDFNVVSFGGHSTSLWATGSRPYNQATLDEAASHIDSMQANYGGTEIRLALEAVFAVRKTDRPTSLFVLTDGDAWDLQGVLSSIKSAVRSSPPSAYLRIFALGIGGSASTAMVEGIARVGNGTSSFVVDGESFTGKAARLLRAARAPLITDIRINWHKVTAEEKEGKGGDDEFELLESDDDQTVAQDDQPPISLFDKEVDPLEDVYIIPLAPSPLTLSPPPPVQQSPHIIRGLSPANRLYAYAILSPPLSSPSSLAKSITLTGSLLNGQKVSLSVPVTLLKIPGSKAVHTLAARKLIQDWEDGQHDEELIAGGKGLYDIKERTKAEVVRLGKFYGIASTHTSFVAVDESEVDAAKKRRKEHTKKVEIAPTLFGNSGSFTFGQPSTVSSMFGRPNPSSYSAQAPPAPFASQVRFFRSNPNCKIMAYTLTIQTSPFAAQAQMQQYSTQPTGFGGGGGLFGSTSAFGAQAAPRPAGFSFGSATAPSPSAGGFGSVGGLFGASASKKRTTGGGLFGAAPASNTSTFSASAASSHSDLFEVESGANVFGASRATGALSGQASPVPSPTGGLFGRPPTGAPAAGGLFGGLPSAKSASGGLFGQASPAASSGGGLFGANSTPITTYGPTPGGPSTPKSFLSLAGGARLDALVRYQAFDGSFGVEVIKLCGKELPKVLASIPTEVEQGKREFLAATFVAMTFLEKELQGEEDAWEGMWEKAKAFCVEALGDEKFELVKKKLLTA